MIASLNEGTFLIGTDRKFIPVKASEPHKKGTLKLGINPFLIHNSKITALIDAGLGAFGPGDHYNRMKENLKKFKLTPDDIQHVYCSHLHTDHIGGLLSEKYGTFDITFPNATIWLSGKDWKRFKDKAEKKGHDDTVRWALFLETHANLRYIEDTPPQPENSIQMNTIGGHTQYHQAILYKDNEIKAMMLGDVLGRAEAINRRFVAKYDYDGKKSQQIRDQYLKKAYENNFYLLTYHGSKGAIVALKNHNLEKGYQFEYLSTEHVGRLH